MTDHDPAMIDRLARVLGDEDGAWRQEHAEACPICLSHGWVGVPQVAAQQRDPLAFWLAAALTDLYDRHVSTADGYDHVTDGPYGLCRDCRAAAVYLTLVAMEAA